MIFENVAVDYTTTTNLTSGILAGRIQGTNNLVENITIINGTMNNDNVLAGGLIGYASPTSGTGTGIIRDIHIENTTVSGGYNSAPYGNGGLIATVNNFELTIEDVYVEADVTSTSNGNTGGLIGTVNGSSILTIDNAIVDYATLTVDGTGSTLGSGGAIGKLTNSGHQLSNIQISNTTITSASQSGGLIGIADDGSATLDLDGIDISNTNIETTISNDSSGAGGIFGVMDGYTTTMTNMSIDADITALNNANAGGLAAVITTASEVQLNGLDVTNTNVSIDGSGSTLGAGGFIGLLNGSTHTLTNISVLDSNISSAAYSGGLIGFAQETSGILNMNTLNVTGSTITTMLAGTTAGIGGVVASLNDYTFNLTDAYVSSSITTSANNSAGGIVGYANSLSVLDFDDITVDQSTISASGSSSVYGSGGIVGMLLGTGHQFNQLRILDTSISNDRSAGGVIGRSEQKNNSTINIGNVAIIGSTIYVGSTSGTEGAGGIVGRTRHHIYNISDVYIESEIKSNRSNAAGIVGFARYIDLTVTRAVVYSDLIVENPGTNSNRGAAGIISRYRDEVASQITDFFYTGYLEARENSGTVYSAILKVINDNLTYTNVRSAQVSYYLSSTVTPITTQTLYDNMFGQSPTYSTTYTQLRSSLDTTYWSTNFSTITASSLWTYNATTHLYELID